MAEKPEEKSIDPIKEGSSTSDNSAASDVDEAAAIAEVDAILAEEDPEFLKKVSTIQVGDGTSDLSILDDVIHTMGAPRKRNPIRWRFHIHNLINPKNDPKKFLMFWALVGLFGAIIYYAPKLSEKYFSKGLFLRSFAEWNADVKDFNPLTEAEYFYDNPRFAKNLMTMTKLVTNIKPSENSGNNPMVAMEINVEGTSAESIIEIKDREAEFKDVLLRLVEEYSYDELGTTEGKKSLLDKFNSAINANLTQGQVRRVLLKSFITKP